MSEEFRRKLKAYMEGKLSDDEAALVEREMEKLEDYQAIVDEQLDQEKSLKYGDKNTGNHEKDREGENADDDKKDGGTKKGRKTFVNNQKGILRRGKWRARIHNALVAVAIVAVLYLISGIITSVYYSSGSPARADLYRDVVKSAIAVTEPNISMAGGGSMIGGLFSMEIEGDLMKTVGGSDITVGEIGVNFLFGQAGFPERKRLVSDIESQAFVHPVFNTGSKHQYEWETLEKLPEGTVVEASLSFDRFFETDEILKEFEDRDMSPLWFAVETEFIDDEQDEYSQACQTMGFPYMPLWHHDDWTVTSHKEESWGLFGKTVAESAQAPSVEEYGSGDVRNKNFLDTLKLLDRYESIANRVISGRSVDFEERIKYIEENGAEIYGMVVTGPTKEVLRLKGEPWISGIRVGEVRLWNWNE